MAEVAKIISAWQGTLELQITKHIYIYIYIYMSWSTQTLRIIQANTRT